MENEKSSATAIPRFDEEHKQFIKNRLIHGVRYWQIVDLFMVEFPDFQSEGVKLADYRKKLYKRVLNHATDPAYPMSREIKDARAETDERVSKLAGTDKYLQLATLCNYVEREWRPRTFVKTATDSDGNDRSVYKDNIGQLIQCYNMINKLAAELGLVQSGDTTPTGTAKPTHWRIAQAQAEGAPTSDDAPPTQEFPSRAGLPRKEKDPPSRKRSKPKIPIKI